MVSDSPLYLGIDLGGTTITSGLLDSSGNILTWENYPTRGQRGPQGVIAEMARRVLAMLEQNDIAPSQVERVGIASPGPLDFSSGRIVETPNLKWEDVPLRDMLSERLDLPVVLEGDAIAATYGEWWTGAARPYEDVVGLTLGTGVGGGVIIGNRVLHGFRGLAGHIGHMSIKVDGRLCGCGNPGCLEAYASATAIRQRTREAIEAGAESVLAQQLEHLDSRAVYQAAQEGDELARRIFDKTGYYLAVGINNIFNILNPQAVVIMGSVANAWDLLQPAMEKYLKDLAFSGIAQETKVLRGTLGDLAGLVGAAGRARGGQRDAH
ncbi:MAG TPA: ROK family protein [Acidobacteriota bacterium]|nr:ROK family protein [Acidobacteriota bacterium]